MGTWTIIDEHYPEDNGTETVDIEYFADIMSRIDYFINNNGNPRLIICEGDSWFHYSRFFGYSNLLLPMKQEFVQIDNNDSQIAWALVNIASSSDTLAEMVNNRQGNLLKSILKEYKKHIKFVLLSAGGNDIIDEIRYSNLLTPNGLNQANFTNLMIDIKSNYEKMVSIIHKGTNNQKIPIFTHCYDYLCAFGKCSILTKFLKCPWIEPIIKTNGLQTKIDSIVVTIFDEFYQKINSVSGLNGIRTIGTLNKDPNNWSDEIHPNTNATNQIATIYVKGILKKQRNLLT